MQDSAHTRTQVRFRNRDTGSIVTEEIVAESFLRWVYENPIGFRVYEWFLNKRMLCQLYGYYRSCSFTRADISEFVKKHQIDTTEFELPLQSYPNFNAFFSRKLKPDARPFTTDPCVFCSPAEGKVLVYPQLNNLDRLPVKGGFVSNESLLGPDCDSSAYNGGSGLVLRLSPPDYHRFHFPDEGTVHSTQAIQGKYHSVSPIALTRIPGLYGSNARVVTEFLSRNFGRIAYTEVGAMTVGSIKQTHQPGVVQKGQEKGYFQFGGSTIVLLFEPDAIVFDDDLVQDSAAGLEVAVRAGRQLGVKWNR